MVEIVRTPVGVTGTEQATKHYGGDERARLQAKFGKEHARALEQIFFFGVRDIQSTNQRLCGGLFEFIATNVTNSITTMTEALWQGYLRTAFRYGSAEKVAFCSPLAVTAIEGYARSNIRVENDRADTYGVSMSTYVSGQGTIHLVMHRDWKDSANYGGFIFVVDMEAVEPAYLRPTRLRQNVQAPDYDGFKDEYLTEVGLRVIHERKHTLLTGITG